MGPRRRRASIAAMPTIGSRRAMRVQAAGATFILVDGVADLEEVAGLTASAADLAASAEVASAAASGDN